MAIHRTLDHEEIREWIEKNNGRPALIRGTTTDEDGGELTLIFKNDESNAEPITWREFFEMFEIRKLRFRYEDPKEDNREPSWTYSFENREIATESSDKDQMPEDVTNIEENMFPSAPRKEGSDAEGDEA